MHQNRCVHIAAKRELCALKSHKPLTAHSEDKLLPVTHAALATDVKAVTSELDVTSEETSNVQDAKAIISEQKEHIKHVAKSAGELVAILLGDAHSTYKVISEAKSVQLLVTLREQQLPSVVDVGSEAQSSMSPSITVPHQRGVEPGGKSGSAAKSMFTAPRSASKKMPKKTPAKSTEAKSSEKSSDPGQSHVSGTKSTPETPKATHSKPSANINDLFSS